MKNKKHPEYYFYVSLICLVLLFLNFYRTDSWTGDKPFSEYLARDWQLFAIFMIEEIIIISAMLAFFMLSLKCAKKQKALFIEKRENDKYLGIKPGDYDYVWFDFSNTERALILKQANTYMLYVQDYNERTGDWTDVGGVSVYDDLKSLKKDLFYEYDFYCNENCVLDKHGDELYKE